VEKDLTPICTDRAPIFETKTTPDRHGGTRIKNIDYCWRVRVPVKPTETKEPEVSYA
jgi:hypothetical protein